MGANPTVLIQMLIQYANYKSDRRTFKFTRNNRLKVHRETDEECMRRKSVLSPEMANTAKNAVRDCLRTSLYGKAGKVYISEEMKKVAIPLNMSASESGLGVLATGTRVKIPEGKVIRAFTYWNKVNDIDLSCFLLTSDNEQHEFSWRSCWRSKAITFSGDQTSGYNGGSEYFDISIEKLMKDFPSAEYLIFCDNVYSDMSFKDCFCKAGFMIRDELDSGEVYEPKTVKSSFRVMNDARFCYLFAIDLKTREMVWLNLARDERRPVAGTEEMDFVRSYITMTDCINVYDLFDMAGKRTENKDEAKLFITDEVIENLGEREQIRSTDFEKILKYIN